MPIVALTANAGADERERYLAAGMTDCLVKPIDRGALIAVLSALPRKRIAGGRPDTVDGAFDFSMLELLREEIGAAPCSAIVDAALADIERLLASCRAAVVDGDHHALRRHAHSLAGVAVSVGATKLAALARALEHHGPNVAEAAELDLVAGQAVTVLIDQRG